MRIFDCHYHIEQNQKDYDIQNVTGRNVIFNFVEDYMKYKKDIKEGDVISLVLDCFNNKEFVLEEFCSNKVNAVKINSRDQKFETSAYPEIISSLKIIPDKLPVIYDAFYYGDKLEYQPSLSNLIKMCRLYPNKNFIVGHSGGYEILKYFFHLRTLNNVYYDLSLSLLYLEDSSCFKDLVKLIKYTDKSKILFGTDFFWAPAKKQQDIFVSILNKLGISDSQRALMFHDNSFSLFSN